MEIRMVVLKTCLFFSSGGVEGLRSFRMDILYMLNKCNQRNSARPL